MRWVTRVFRRRRLETQLDAELRDHLDRQIADYMRAGLSEPDARRKAVLLFGGVDAIKESCRDARGTRWLDEVGQDLRYGWRMLRRSPGYTLVAVLSLALGIGANTAIFSLVDGLLLRTLPVRDSQRLALLQNGDFTYPIWEQIRDRQTQLFEGALAWSESPFDLSRGGPTEFVDGLWVSGGFFEVLGVPPILGRTLTAADDRRGGGPDGAVAVISYRFWQRHFGGAADTIGRTITLSRVPYTIVGVTPPEFVGPSIGRTFDVAVPYGTEPLLRGAETWLDGRSTWWITIMVRLRPDQDIEAGNQALRAAQPQIREAAMPTQWGVDMQKEFLHDAFTIAPAAKGPSGFRETYQRPLLTIMVVVALVLLIACANVANLALARANGRRHEVSLRLALGASRVRLARQWLTESVMLASLGAALGLVFAQAGSRLLIRQISTGRDPVSLELSLDWRVLGFTAAVAIGTALLFGVAPAWRAGRVDPLEALKEQGRGPGAQGRWPLGTALVVAQVALSLVLVVAAGLFVRTFASLATRPLGFEQSPLLVVTVDAQRSAATPAQRAALFERVREAAAAAPGVARAGISLITPVSGMGWNDELLFPDQPQLGARDRIVWFNGVSPSWFATYGTPLIAGRDFDTRDGANGTPVAIVNQAFVRKYGTGTNPVGQSVLRADAHNGEPPPPLQIVGVVQDAAYRSVRETPPPTVYVPMAQMGDMRHSRISLTVRAAGGAPALLTQGVATAIGGVDRDLSLAFQPLTDMVGATLARERTVALLSGFFGALALLLAGIGLYGVTSYAVSRRRMEIGIRMALGADASGVARLVLARVALMVGLGVLIGAVISLWAARFVSTLLFGLEPRDPATLGGAAAILAIIGGLAAWLPARRAARIDAARVLREG